ncbi:serine/threonine protein kinase, partial [Candidatus Woesearchaeota archaeon]|nr:serine/threonine protein kinase [Candidatus Woesearchaeota archaeon]MBW3006493.1 serine/threonine protein kinase [Candidatus Woesearchaeota archaeon]
MSDSEDILSIREEPPRDPENYTGRTIDGYTLGEKLGEGGIGVVYSAEKDGKTFAVKLLRQNNPSLGSTLQKEFTAQEKISHENIRKINEFHQSAVFDDNGNEPLAMLVMEYVDGSHLDVTKVDDESVYSMTVQIKNALKAAHDAGIVHKDLKPTNILITKDGKVKVSDFGLAKIVQEHSLIEQSMPISNVLPEHSITGPGTYGYFPPGENEAEPARDLYSLGVILYQMVTGTKDFPDPDVYDDVKEASERKKLEHPEAIAELVKNLVSKKQKRCCDISELETLEGYRCIANAENRFFRKVSEYLKDQLKYCEGPVENQEELIDNMKSYLTVPRKHRLQAVKNVLFRFSPKDREYLANILSSKEFHGKSDSDELLRISLKLFSFEEFVKLSDLSDSEQYQKMWKKFNKASDLATECGFEEYFEQQEMELWARYKDKFDQAEAAEKTCKELETEQSQNITEANFPTYQKYIQLINQLNPAKIKDELADNIAYSAWKEGLAPEYVDYIVESIARRREKGLLGRVKEGLFETKDEYSGKSKQEIREELKKYAEIIHPAYVEHAKKIGRKYNIFVEDIIEEAVRKLAERAEKRKDRIGSELMDALRKRYPKAFQNRPEYSQLEINTNKIAKKPKDTDYSFFNIPNFLYNVPFGIITDTVVTKLSGSNFIGGLGMGVGFALGEAYVARKKKKTREKWAQQEKDQKSIDETVKKLMQGEKVEEKTPEEKTSLLSRIKNYALSDLYDHKSVQEILTNALGWPVLGGLLASGITAATNNASVPLSFVAGAAALLTGWSYVAIRGATEKKITKSQVQSINKVDKTEQKEETPLVNPLTGNEMHIFSPVGVAGLKRIVSNAYSTLRKKLSKE